ncbi:MAG: DUF4252 domain-containing protein [Muribaculaceae bacterium]|nr:DUF4252 domain-containing protein [Muribaculaceae bacterium]
MKNFLVLALVAMISVTGFSKTIDEVFNAFPKADNVQEMTLDKAMLAMAMSAGADQSKAKAMKGLDAIRLIAIEDPTSEQINIAREIMKDGVDGFDVMIDSSEDGEDALILTQGDGNVINKMLIIAVEEDNVAVVMLEGEIDPKDTDKMVNFGK